MGVGLEDDLVSALAVHQHGDEVSHGSRGHEERGLGSELGRRVILEFIYRRVLHLHIVAQPGAGDALQHLLGRQGDGVAAQIYGLHNGTTNAPILPRSLKVRYLLTILEVHDSTAGHGNEGGIADA